MKPTTSPHIRVARSKIHSTGVYAKKGIRKGTKIIEYVGEKLTKKESDKRADVALDKHAKDKNNGAVYIFELNKKYDIDGDFYFNTAKFINHSCNPNCDVEISNDKIWIIALRQIKKGEELSYNYGYDYEDYEDHVCHCGSDKCVGYILSEDHWPKLKRSLARKKKKR
ncbi:SET domain-containing protein [Candidatus Woesearchaeota archaeon]|nr:SET domain-containing protein [Candidatus Woesearchaeota archaeon]